MRWNILLLLVMSLILLSACDDQGSVMMIGGGSGGGNTTNIYNNINQTINQTADNNSITVSLDNITDPTVDKSFNFGTKNFNIMFNQGTLQIDQLGAFSNDLVHIHQHIGNPLPGSHLLHLEAEDPDVLVLNALSGASITANFSGNITANGLSLVCTGNNRVCLNTSDYGVQNTSLWSNINAKISLADLQTQNTSYYTTWLKYTEFITQNTSYYTTWIKYSDFTTQNATIVHNGDQNQTTSACQNITGATSNLCTITDTSNTTAQMQKAVNISTGLNLTNLIIGCGQTSGACTLGMLRQNCTNAPYLMYACNTTGWRAVT